MISKCWFRQAKVNVKTARKEGNETKKNITFIKDININGHNDKGEKANDKDVLDEDIYEDVTSVGF